MMKKTMVAAGLICCLCSSAYAMDKSTYFTGDGDCEAAKVVYDYKPDSLFQVNAQMGFVSDIQLKPGEKINYIGAGDTKRWLIDKATVGSAEHIYIGDTDQHDHQHRCPELSLLPRLGVGKLHAHCAVQFPR